MVKIASMIPTAEIVGEVLTGEMKNLPSFPEVAARLIKVVSEEKTSVTELVRIVETDPALAARVMRLVNSAQYGRTEKIVSLSTAISLAGFDRIRSLALEISIYEHLVGSSNAVSFDRGSFWRHCLAVASLARAMAREINHPDPEEAYLAGLLHDIGKIILDVRGRVSYQNFIRTMKTAGSGPGGSSEESILGLSHTQIGGFFAVHWGLPDAVTHVILLHHDRFGAQGLSLTARQTIAIVSLANFIAWSQGIGSLALADLPILQPEIDELVNMAQLDFEALIRTMDHDVKEVAQYYGLFFPDLSECRTNLLAANITLARINSRYLCREDDFQKKITRLDHIRQSLSQLHGTLDTREVVATTIKAIERDYHFDRLCLFFVDKESRRLVSEGLAKEQTGFVNPEQFTLPLNQDAGKILDCLRLRQPLIVTREKEGEIKLLDRFGCSQMGLVPVASNVRVLGLLAVGTSAAAESFSLGELGSLTIIAHELGVALENARLFEEMKVRADIDSLTELYNRGAADRFLTKAFHEVMTGKPPFSLALIDVDYFKRFNDRHGHPAGDKVLRLLATAMRRFSRPADKVCRYGGEEFLLLLSATPPEDAVHCVERFRSEVESLGRMMLPRFPETSITVSAGLCSYHPACNNVRELLEIADLALYRAKNGGRNRITFLSWEEGRNFLSSRRAAVR